MFQPVRQVSVNFADNEKQSNKTFNDKEFDGSLYNDIISKKQNIKIKRHL
mgnify:CR=1 FL=1